LEEKRGYNETVLHLFIDLKKAYDSCRREVLYNIVIEFEVRLLKICLNEMYSKVCMGKYIF
jgi:hypothetical protein